MNRNWFWWLRSCLPHFHTMFKGNWRCYTFPIFAVAQKTGGLSVWWRWRCSSQFNRKKIIIKTANEHMYADTKTHEMLRKSCAFLILYLQPLINRLSNINHCNLFYKNKLRFFVLKSSAFFSLAWQWKEYIWVFKKVTNTPPSLTFFRPNN